MHQADGSRVVVRCHLSHDAVHARTQFDAFEVKLRAFGLCRSHRDKGADCQRNHAKVAVEATQNRQHAGLDRRRLRWAIMG